MAGIFSYGEYCLSVGTYGENYLGIAKATGVGSLTAACKLIGFQPKPRYRWAQTEARFRSVIDPAVADISAAALDSTASARTVS